MNSAVTKFQLNQLDRVRHARRRTGRYSDDSRFFQSTWLAAQYSHCQSKALLSHSLICSVSQSIFTFRIWKTSFCSQGKAYSLAVKLFVFWRLYPKSSSCFQDAFKRVSASNRRSFVWRAVTMTWSNGEEKDVIVVLTDSPTRPCNCF